MNKDKIAGRRIIMAQVMYQGTGRRKTAIARVRIIPGEGRITVNNQEAEQYFPRPIQLGILREPLEITETAGQFDILVRVEGGGVVGQAGAVRLGLARALLKANPALRPSLKKAGFLTRDPRMKERRKYGLKKARKAPQFSKR
jgi:small subunit ribosomal protein S9